MLMYKDVEGLIEHKLFLLQELKRLEEENERLKKENERIRQVKAEVIERLRETVDLYEEVEAENG